MVCEARLQKGDKFKVHTGVHVGRIYTVDNFAPCKFGQRFAVCRWTDKPGDCFLFTEKDLSEFGMLFQMWDTSQRETDAVYIERRRQMRLVRAN